jgi:hypothetical protein
MHFDSNFVLCGWTAVRRQLMDEGTQRAHRRARCCARPRGRDVAQSTKWPAIERRHIAAEAVRLPLRALRRARTAQ